MITNLLKKVFGSRNDRLIKQYSRAVCAVQKVLRQYGFGGFCSDYGEYLLLLRQEVTADAIPCANI